MMSDLQCPATVLLLAREILGSSDCERACAGRRLSGVFVDTTVAADSGAFAWVSDLAARDNARIEVAANLVDGASLELALEELADLYRGETIAIVTRGDVIQACVSTSPDEPIAVAIDASGWAITKIP